ITPATAHQYRVRDAADSAIVSDAAVATSSRYGDANADGEVDDNDYDALNDGILHGLSGWAHGDFDNSGTATDADYVYLDNAYNSQAIGAVTAAALNDSSIRLSWAD